MHPNQLEDLTKTKASCWKEIYLNNDSQIARHKPLRNNESVSFHKLGWKIVSNSDQNKECQTGVSDEVKPVFTEFGKQLSQLVSSNQKAFVLRLYIQI